MSGRHFDYVQYNIGLIADEIRHFIEINDSHETDADGDKVGYSFSKEIIEKFKKS